MNTSLASRLSAIRSRAGLTQADLAALAGLKNPSHVGMIERGERSDIAATTATALARTLGTTAEYLVDGEGDAPLDDALRAAVARARRTAQPVADESRPSHPATA
jgi:transcriptional regulator with XRE-family HTH domain